MIQITLNDAGDIDALTNMVSGFGIWIIGAWKQD